MRYIFDISLTCLRSNVLAKGPCRIIIQRRSRYPCFLCLSKVFPVTIPRLPFLPSQFIVLTLATFASLEHSTSAPLIIVSSHLHEQEMYISSQPLHSYSSSYYCLGSRFFTDISHELRTPLTLIANPIEEVINNESLSQEGHENMITAKRNTDRMLKLINQILDFRKIQNNKMKLYIEQVDVLPLFKQTFENFSSIAHQKDIHFELNCPQEYQTIYTDIDKLEKILFNLLSNAFKYTPNGKNILITVTFDKNALNFSIKDEGKGFDLYQIDTLFKRFETLGQKDNNLSSGIGLSLVKELVHLLHGSIKVDSTLGKGRDTSKTLPLPKVLSTFIDPCSRCTNSFTNESPMPLDKLLSFWPSVSNRLKRVSI